MKIRNWMVSVFCISIVGLVSTLRGNFLQASSVLADSQLISDEEPSCQRPTECQEVPYFDLIKEGQTSNPNYRYRDKRYLCFYLVDAKTLKRLKGQTIDEVNQWVLTVFNGIYRSGPFTSSRKYFDQYLSQMRLFSDCNPVPALVTLKVWNASKELIYIDVKHTANKK